MLDGESKGKQARLIELVGSHDRIVFFGGAGVSTESGIPDFRSASGIFTTSGLMNPEQVVSRSFFDAHPDEFYDFYRSSMIFPDAKPNRAHEKLAELERGGKLIAVVTQNVDGLHQAAGSNAVFELHGSIHRNFCMGCGAPYGLDFVMSAAGVPRCGKCGGVVKPDVVLYEEALDPDVIRGACAAVATADMLIVSGTSLVVYPAASFIDLFRGDALVVVNKSATSADSRADLVINAPVGEVLDW